MRSGHLIVETSSAHPEWVRIYTADTPPSPPILRDADEGPVPRQIVFFDDLSAARMHAHELLRRRLIDIDAGLYRATAVEAAAAVESIALTQRRVFLDPEVVSDRDLSRQVARLRARRLRADRTWRLLGYAAVLFLFVKLLFGF